MQQHRTFMEEFGCIPEDAAIRIANLRYDELAAFLRQLTLKFASDSSADRERQRHKLAQKLLKLARQIEAGAKTTDEIWNICKSYMQENQEKGSP